MAEARRSVQGCAGLILCVNNTDSCVEAIGEWTEFVESEKQNRQTAFLSFIVGLNCPPLAVDIQRKINFEWTPITSSLVVATLLRCTRSTIAQELVTFHRNGGKRLQFVHTTQPSPSQSMTSSSGDLTSYLLQENKHKDQKSSWGGFFCC